VFGADVVVAELQCLAQRELEHLLRPRRERNVAARAALAPADDLLDRVADGGRGDAEIAQHDRGDAVVLADQPEQHVLGADVVVAQLAGLLLGQHHGLSRAPAESLEHGCPLGLARW
jgi:hypothetical protein